MKLRMEQAKMVDTTCAQEVGKNMPTVLGLPLLEMIMLQGAQEWLPRVQDCIPEMQEWQGDQYKGTVRQLITFWQRNQPATTTTLIT